jgi:hypothetical protein
MVWSNAQNQMIVTLKTTYAFLVLYYELSNQAQACFRSSFTNTISSTQFVKLSFSLVLVCWCSCAPCSLFYSCAAAQTALQFIITAELVAARFQVASVRIAMLDTASPPNDWRGNHLNHLQAVIVEVIRVPDLVIDTTSKRLFAQ